MSYDLKHKKKKHRGFLKFVGVFLLLLACLGLVVWLYLKQDTVSQITITPATKQQVNVVAGEQVFSTSYFSFTANDDWRIEESVTKEDEMYMYSQFKNGNSIRYIRVYVNNKTPRYQTPYVVPISIINGKITPEGPVSEHCRQQGINDYRVGERDTVQSGVEFLCDVDATDSRTVAGLVGGNLRLPGLRADGTPFDLIIEYKDVGFTRDDKIFLAILKTFEIK